MEKYLPYCLDSLLIGNYRELLEVLIVNDGSKDSTLEIAQKYAGNYPDVFWVVDKPNGNYGSCINAAIPLVTGKYVKVLDADDSFDTANFEQFLKFLDNTDADLVLSDFTLVDSERKKIKDITYPLGKEILPMAEACVQDSFKNMEMHAVTYRTKILTDSGYRQTEGVSYTDQQWIFAPMAYVHQVGVFNTPVYQYMIGRAGQTMNPEVKSRRMKDRVSYVIDMVKQYDMLYSFVSNETREYLDARIYLNIKDIYITYFTNRKRVARQIVCDFDVKFSESSESLYYKLGYSNSYIKLWRQIIDCKKMEYLFCKVFSVIFTLRTLRK